MSRPLLRIPYTAPFAAPNIIPPSAKTLEGAVAALQAFFRALPPRNLSASTVVLSGAGLSVASGLADYRGTKGTYRVNKSYRPIFYHEFLASHEARRRYWARSFLGWAPLQKGKPNAGHYAVKDLGRLGLISHVITQNVDSYHTQAHPEIPTLELHGYLRSTLCTSCWTEFPRAAFQEELARLNPPWAAFLAEALTSGALETEDPREPRAKGLRANPDGDVDIPGAPYTTFRYPACPMCLVSPPNLPDGSRGKVEVDHEGAWVSSSNAGVLKPAVVMFGESIRKHVKNAAEEAIDRAGRMLVLATSLATYSAWRLAKRAKDRGMPIAVITIGGVRGEEEFFKDLTNEETGARAVRAEVSTESLLPALVEELQQSSSTGRLAANCSAPMERSGADAFRDLLS